MTIDFILLLSVLLGVIAYLGLTLFCLVTIRRQITGKALLVASTTTLAFMICSAVAVATPWMASLELLSQLSWIFLLIRAIGLNAANYLDSGMRSVSGLLGCAVLTAGIGLWTAWQLPLEAFTTPHSSATWLYAMQVLLGVIGLVAIEQLARNARDDYRWRLRYLNVGLGLFFTYGLVHNALGMMFGIVLPLLVILQPAVLAICAPLIAIASMRNRENQLKLNLSRQFVFRSGVLIATGSGLLLLGLAGYYVRLFGGDVGVAVVLMVATLLAVAAFIGLGSKRVQWRLRRWMGKNLYGGKHDYREAWNSASRQLTEPSPDFDLGQQAIRSVLDVFEASGGALWRLMDADSLVLEAKLHVDWNEPLAPATGQALRRFYGEHDWVIDLRSLPAEADNLLSDCTDLVRLPGIRYLLPLHVEQRLYGVIGIREPESPAVLEWEDYDLVKLISRQAAGFLALRRADAEIGETRQFAALNRLTTFIVHDVKTISAQLSLLSENATRHKTNPAFIDDMLATIDNSVHRMQRLLLQLKNPQSDSVTAITLGELLPAVAARFTGACPRPTLHTYNPDATIRADRDRLVNVLSHVVQNAIDATGESGTVQITARKESAWLEIAVEDTGCGMDEAFIANRLFSPFESTKGLTGMGIGAYQVREYVRGLGGEVSVSSTPAVGTRFLLKLPMDE
ncbi:MAG: PEP-CTERM system histidine kinase PrsK [Pseudomonadales bacterium]